MIATFQTNIQNQSKLIQFLRSSLNPLEHSLNELKAKIDNLESKIGSKEKEGIAKKINEITQKLQKGQGDKVKLKEKRAGLEKIRLSLNIDLCTGQKINSYCATP